MYRARIGLGNGVCLNSGKLVIAGILKLKYDQRRLFVMRSVDNGDIWTTDVKPLDAPPDATLGEHIQVVEYANDLVNISCSFEGSKQCFCIYSDTGFKVFDCQIKDANPECQGCIVRLPTKTNKFYHIAMASHGNETDKDLTLYLSEDGCKTWYQFNTLGAVNAEESDLAYYSVKEGEEEAKGIVCVTVMVQKQRVIILECS
ncbi:uncharacterized protein [Antedon mediterranea]|uniref:uncharacterized protein n=1 Tax=Antedon mediterranea TaxID=105859 RepID=UPI003AF882FE